MTRQFLQLLVLLFLSASCYEANTNTNSEVVLESEGQEQFGDTAGLAKATFAGGCFWCTEAYFERLQGVEEVISGYAGGTLPKPTYQQVSAGKTDYAEAVQIYYDSTEISYQELLEVFFATHDPTTLNRQEPDVGKQYRSIVFHRTPEEKKQVQQYISELNEAGTFPGSIVTTVEAFTKFWPAEDYHQNYYRLNPKDPYVATVATPKVKKFETKFQYKLKPTYRSK